MTHRERVLSTFRFQETDQTAVDLMEGFIWSPADQYFYDMYNFSNAQEIIDHLDTDFRWIGLQAVDPNPPPQPSATQEESAPVIQTEQPAVPPPVIYSQAISQGPLANASTVKEVESFPALDPAWWQPADYAAARKQWPDHALVLGHLWLPPVFWGTCEAFGMENALLHMHADPKMFHAYAARHHAAYMDILSRCLPAARGHCDICWLGDDYASQKAMIMSPDLWRKHLKPYLAEQTAMARANDMFVIFHSCGSVRAIIPDLIDIGVNGLLVFQTTAQGMDPESIARDFGGKFVFYGGMDVQQLLSFSSPLDVQKEVQRNIKAFSKCGGYIVANSHHCVDTIKGENIEAMCRAAQGIRL